VPEALEGTAPAGFERHSQRKNTMMVIDQIH
jgi:hypothetical protein